MTTFPSRRTEFTRDPRKLSPSLLVLELKALEIRVEKEDPTGTIRGGGGGGGAGAGVGSAGGIAA